MPAPAPVRIVSRACTTAAAITPTTPTATIDRERPLHRDRLDPQVLGAVDAEQHDDEQEQHDDRAGVDDHLHRGEEVGVLGDEQHGDAEQRQDRG